VAKFLHKEFLPVAFIPAFFILPDTEFLPVASLPEYKSANFTQRVFTCGFYTRSVGAIPIVSFYPDTEFLPVAITEYSPGNFIQSTPMASVRAIPIVSFSGQTRVYIWSGQFSFSGQTRVYIWSGQFSQGN
jgi:hypothetical protein